jgi:penicillin-binding protein-related factor A (putative recombinase)
MAPYGVKWLTNNKEMFNNCLMIDWKIIRGKSFPIDKVMPSQRRMMPIGKTHDGVVFSLPDTGSGDRDPSPCDAVYVMGAKSYLVFWVYVRGQRRESREVIWLDIDDWLELEREAKAAGKKSVRVERIREKGFRQNIF